MTSNAIELPDCDRCAFCAYLAGTRPYTIVRRNVVVAIMVTREQRGLPHLLVVPLRHVETVLDLNDAEASALMIGVRQAARAIDVAYQRPGIAVWQNNGVAANQTINHVHFHVAGALDAGGTEWGEVEELPVDQTELIRDKVEPHLVL